MTITVKLYIIYIQTSPAFTLTDEEGHYANRELLELTKRTMFPDSTTEQPDIVAKQTLTRPAKPTSRDQPARSRPAKLTPHAASSLRSIGYTAPIFGLTRHMAGRRDDDAPHSSTYENFKSPNTRRRLVRVLVVYLPPTQIV